MLLLTPMPLTPLRSVCHTTSKQGNVLGANAREKVLYRACEATGGTGGIRSPREGNRRTRQTNRGVLLAACALAKNRAAGTGRCARLQRRPWAGTRECR